MEEALVAEDIDEVGQSFGGHTRNHLVDDEVDIVLLMAAILHGDAVGAEEVGLDGHGRGFFQAADDAQELQLALGGEAVAALDLDGAGTEAHHLVEALAGHIVELVLGGGGGGFGGVEDAAATLGDLLVAEAADLVDELMLAGVGIDDVGVGVAEGGEEQPAGGVDHAGSTGVLACQLAHGSELFDDAVLNDEVGVLDGFQLGHFLALLAELRSRFHPHQFLDISD